MVFTKNLMGKIDEQIDAFLACKQFAVVGASDRPHKYGYRCYKTYVNHDMAVQPVNPRLHTIEGKPCYPKLSALPLPVEAISVITPPAVTEEVIEEAISLGIKHIWLQPGAESAKAVQAAKEANINIIYGGPCLMVVLGYR